jgi:hypothetical protein
MALPTQTVTQLRAAFRLLEHTRATGDARQRLPALILTDASGAEVERVTLDGRTAEVVHGLVYGALGAVEG